MTEQEQAEVRAIEEEIKNLDAEFEVWQEQRGDVPGNQSEIYQRVGENIVKDAQYRQKRQDLLKRKADIEGVSDGVRAYLDGKKNKSQMEFSKLDKPKEDNSLNPLGGKPVRVHQIAGMRLAAFA